MKGLWGYKTSCRYSKFELNNDLKRYSYQVLRKGENGMR